MGLKNVFVHIYCFSLNIFYIIGQADHFNHYDSEIGRDDPLVKRLHYLTLQSNFLHLNKM